MRHTFTNELALPILFAALAGCSSNADPAEATQNQNVGGGAGAGAPGPTPGPLPCAIETLVKTRCQTCHGATPIGGAPMSLLTATDFQQTYTVRTTVPLMNQSLKLAELAAIRINGEQGTPKMPQGNALSPADLQTLTQWLRSGASSGPACGAPPGSGGNGQVMSGNGGTASYAGSPSYGGYGTAGASPGAGGGGVVGSGGTPPVGSNVISENTPDECANDPTQFQPLIPKDGETCYEFKAHGVSGANDQTKFTVAPGQSYNQFYFDVPWPANSVATRFGAKFDSLSVLHHWLGFTSTKAVAAGTVEKNVLGTTLGESAELIGGWAVGGCNVTFPPDMGVKLPNTGKIMIQWHHYNSTGAPVQDGTAVQFCVVPESQRKNIGGLTFLGTENFNGLAGMPAGKESKFSGTCVNDSGKPITIVGWNPHMHLLGTHMNSTVVRAAGGTEVPFDHSFLFDHQVNYMLKQGYVLQPGDKITSTCTFNNTTTAPVAFGQSTQQEMCYQFTFSYPWGALNNGTPSLIGATNTCW